jgi:heterotetrameric sarcosine oxidase gamma subunit
VAAPAWAPVARSPIPQPPPTAIVDGWEVHVGRSSAPLRLVDCTPLAKVLVRTLPDSEVAAGLGVGLGRAARDRHGTLVVGSGPDEWLLLAAPGKEQEVAERVRAMPCGDGTLVSVVEVFSHGRALLRLTGVAGPKLLAKVCAVDFADRVTPNGAAFRTAVAKVATDVIRDDLNGERSYLLHCERSSGQYLFGALLDAGAELGVEQDGFAGNGFTRRGQ